MKATKKKQTPRYREQTSGYHRGDGQDKGGGMGSMKNWM